MGLKAVVDDVTSLEENMQSLYVKDETLGKYVLDVDEAEGYVLENTSGLKSALNKERNSVKTLTKSLKTYEERFKDIDPDEAREALEKVVEYAAFDPKVEADKIAEGKVNTLLEKQEKKLRKEFADTVARDYQPVLDKFPKLEASYKKRVVEAEALKAIADEEGDAGLLLPHVVNRIKFSMNEDGEYESSLVDERSEVMLNSKGEKLSAREYVASLKTKFPAAFKSPVSSGGGSSGNSGRGSATNMDNMTAHEKIVAGLEALKNKRR